MNHKKSVSFHREKRLISGDFRSNATSKAGLLFLVCFVTALQDALRGRIGGDRLHGLRRSISSANYHARDKELLIMRKE